MLNMKELNSLVDAQPLDKKALCKKLNISEATLRYILNDLRKPSCETLEAIADYFKCSIDSLFIRNVEYDYHKTIITPNNHEKTIESLEKEIVSLKNEIECKNQHIYDLRKINDAFLTGRVIYPCCKEDTVR